MSERKNQAEPDAKLLAELSALADGTLDPTRSDAVRELIATSPELRQRYERERRAVATLHELRADRAPATLRIAIDTRRHRLPQRRARLVYAGALGVTVAAVVAMLVLLLPGGSPGAPTVSQAAALATRGAAMPPPRELGFKVDEDVQDTYFPNWDRSFHWQASGRRVDRPDGHLAVTVYYVKGSKQIAYTILTSPPLDWTTAPKHHDNGIGLQSFVQDGRTIVSWRRDGHTCVLSSSDMSAGQLARLAAWKAPGLDR